MKDHHLWVVFSLFSEALKHQTQRSDDLLMISQIFGGQPDFSIPSGKLT